MGSSPSSDAELHARIHKQGVVAELGLQASTTDDIDRLMHATTVAVADTLDNEYCKVLELLPGEDEVFESLRSQDEHAATGIGLALCERIVERHGGDIRVESEPGEGATFSFILPTADGRDE